MRSNLEDIEVTVHHQTDKAWLVESEASAPERVWIPKSRCEMSEIAQPSKRAMLTAPEPFLVEKGLI